MKLESNFDRYMRARRKQHAEEKRRLKGVQGPEQGLVGESRSDEPTGHAEEAKPGERRVGETVELSALRRHVDRMFMEASRQQRIALDGENEISEMLNAGRVLALTELRQWLDRTAEERSGLSNS